MDKKFSKTDVNFVLDAALLVMFVLLCWESVIVRFVFPPGSQAEGWSLWGASFDDWIAIQFATLCIFSTGVTLHVMLHWSWVCGVIASKRRKRASAQSAGGQDNGSRTLWGVSLLIVLFNAIGLGVAAAALTVRGP
jgi:hypothetical protein